MLLINSTLFNINLLYHVLNVVNNVLCHKVCSRSFSLHLLELCSNYFPCPHSWKLKIVVVTCNSLNFLCIVTP